MPVCSPSVSRIPACAFDHLAERPVGDPLPVGERAALTPPDQLRIGVGEPEQLPDEAALADPRHADERDELGRALAASPRERAREQRELVITADERRAASLHDVDTEAGAGVEWLPDADRPLLALHEHRLGFAVLDRPLRCPMGRLVDQDPVDRGRGLQARARVDDVAGGHALAGRRQRVERDHRLAGRDADAHVEVLPGRLVLLGDRVADRERRPDGTFRVVLVRGRRAEQGDDGVADELLHRAPEVLELGPQPGVVAAEERADVLGVELLGPAREPGQVAEEHGHDLALLPGRGGGSEGRPAAGAEPGARLSLEAACRTVHLNTTVTDGTAPGQVAAARRGGRAAGRGEGEDGRSSGRQASP